MILIFLACFNLVQGQDSLRHKVTFPAYVISGGLMTTGLYLEGGGRKESFRDWVRERHEVSTTGLDDFLQHSPIVMHYALDLATGKTKQQIARSTRHLLVSQTFTIGTSLLLKSIVNTTRPNNGRLSFPSGHTAYSFASATVLFHSYKDENFALAVSGYVPAIVVGAYRILKDKHWVSDVAFGAGMGMLFTHLSYQLNIWDSATVKVGSDKSNVNLRLAGTADGAGLVLTF